MNVKQLKQKRIKLSVKLSILDQRVAESEDTVMAIKKEIQKKK